jgi:hypothetical protein
VDLVTRSELPLNAVFAIDTLTFGHAVRVRRPLASDSHVSTAPLRSESFLRELLTDLTGGDAIEIQSDDDLCASCPRILHEFPQRYLVSHSPTASPPLGGIPSPFACEAAKGNVEGRAGDMR